MGASSEYSSLSFVPRGNTPRSLGCSISLEPYYKEHTSLSLPGKSSHCGNHPPNVDAGTIVLRPERYTLSACYSLKREHISSMEFTMLLSTTSLVIRSRSKSPNRILATRTAYIPPIFALGSALSHRTSIHHLLESGRNGESERNGLLR